LQVQEVQRGFDALLVWQFLGKGQSLFGNAFRVCVGKQAQSLMTSLQTCANSRHRFTGKDRVVRKFHRDRGT
jgi:hypothetical protein